MSDKISASEITPERLFRSRRQFMKSAGALAAGAAVLAACGTEASAPTSAGGVLNAPFVGRPDRAHECVDLVWQHGELPDGAGEREQ
jgi:hypothetical protein